MTIKRETAKADLKRITDEATGVGASFVEATLEPREFYIYSEVWTITTEQLDRIRKQVNITAISVDGGKLMLTARI